jgi:ABC-type Na+ efflux pump permease subunit
MLGRLGAAVRKDLRLLTRDRAGLVFLTLAPVVVIAVAGLSLASLYGADPRGATAYVLPLVDEDGGRVGRALAAHLADEPAVQLRRVTSRDAARNLVQTHAAGVALVIPAGTSAALTAGRPAPLILYTDPVKYLEVANVRALVQELRHGLESAARNHARARLAKVRARAAITRTKLERAAARLRRDLQTLSAQLAAARAESERRFAAARARTERDVQAALAAIAAARERDTRARLAAALAPLGTFLAELTARTQELAAWFGAVRAQAGRLADRVPPPPAPPAIPAALTELASADADTLARRLLPSTGATLDLPPLPRLELPAPPALVPPAFPTLPEPPELQLPGALAIDETSVTGAPRRLNTFDQNVPGFSVTFLLLGMLLGVSLGLLDEHDWGTLERLRAMPTPFAIALVAKLLARFTVGLVQMVVLFAIGRIAFGVSLGPEPAALLLPTAGIVFAGTAFGLVVAGVARSREAVLPLGSIVIVTMAAVGGCWWPIDLEPDWMRRAALAFPTTWAMAAYNDLMIRRRTVSAVLGPTAVLFAYGALYLAAGLVLFRRHTRQAA